MHPFLCNLEKDSSSCEKSRICKKEEDVSSCVGRWEISSEREALVYLTKQGELEAFVVCAPKNLAGRESEKTRVQKLFAGINQAFFTPSLLRQVQQNPHQYQVVLTEEKGQSILTFIPRLVGGAGEALEEIKKELALVRANPTHPHIQERFFQALEMAQDAQEIPWEEFLETGEILAKAKLEGRAFEVAYKSCEALLELLRKKGEFLRYEGRFLPILNTLHNILVEKECLQETGPYRALALELIPAVGNELLRIESLIAWGDSGLFLAAKSSFDKKEVSLFKEHLRKFEEALQDYRAAYSLASSAQLEEKKTAIFQKMLQVQGRYIQSWLGDCQGIYREYAEEAARGELSREEQIALMEKIERLADYLCVRGVFHQASPSEGSRERRASLQGEFDPVYSLYRLALQLAHVLCVD
eukprot:Opistho-1_new@32321